MKFLIPILCCLLMVACHSSKQVTSPPAPTVTLTDNEVVRVVTNTVTEIDTVPVYFIIPAQSAERVANDTTSHLETDFAMSDAWITPDGRLGHNLRNKPRTLEDKAYVPKTTVNNESEKEVIKEVPVPYPEPYPVEKDLTTWQKVKLAAFWYLIAAVCLLSAWSCRKFLRPF